MLYVPDLPLHCISHKLTHTLVNVKTGEFEWCGSKRQPAAGWHAYPGGEQPQPAGHDAHRGSASAAGCRRLFGHAHVRRIRPTKDDQRGGETPLDSYYIFFSEVA